MGVRAIANCFQDVLQLCRIGSPFRSAAHKFSGFAIVLPEHALVAGYILEEGVRQHAVLETFQVLEKLELVGARSGAVLKQNYASLLDSSLSGLGNPFEHRLVLFASVINALTNVWEPNCVKLGERIPWAAWKRDDNAERVVLLDACINDASIGLECQVEPVVKNVHGFAARPACCRGDHGQDE